MLRCHSCMDSTGEGALLPSLCSPSSRGPIKPDPASSPSVLGIIRARNTMPLEGELVGCCPLHSIGRLAQALWVHGSSRDGDITGSGCHQKRCNGEKKPHVVKRWSHGHSNVTLHLERSSPVCPTHLTPGCNTGTHILLPSSACQSMAALAPALGRDPKPCAVVAGAPTLSRSRCAASQAAALSLSVCLQTG